MKLNLFSVFLMSLALCTFAQDTDSSGKSIGMANREYEDSSRSNWLGTGARPLRVIIRYPATSGGISEFDNTVKITLLKDGDISSLASKYPLIILSPGSGQNAANMSWLGQYLSLNGFIALSINHNGTAEEERQSGTYTLSDFCSWERPRDVSAVLDKILADPVFGKRIDTSRIGTAGFSLGGAVAIWAAGGSLNMDSLKHNSAPPPPQLMEHINKYIELSKTDTIIQNSIKRSGNLIKDQRIKAVFALAPAIGAGFTKEGLSKVDVPVKIVVGDKDIVAPAEKNAKRYADYLKDASLAVLPGERGHYINKISDTERDRELEEVSKLAVEFFMQALRP